MDRIQPSWQDIGKFRNPLTPGELHLAEFLDSVLPKEWEIYVQPYLNGDRPDIVILNPSVGLMIFEVKDWKPECYHFEQSSQGKKVKQYYVTDGRGSHRIPNPLSQVNRYRENIIGLYLPLIGETIDKNTKNLAAFRVGLYFHNMTTEHARILVPTKPHSCTVFGYDILEKEHMDQLVPDWRRKNTLTVFSDWSEEIQFWLYPPYHSLEQGRIITLTSEQERHVLPSPGQHQRLRGVAGSGKTLVIAQRAARLAEQRKKVLIITYNITLWHYIRDHVSRAKHQFSWDQIEFSHFHGFCKNYLSENNIMWPSDGSSSGDLVLSETVPKLVQESKISGLNIKNRQYDAILIDEGQDFEKLWYLALCEFLSENDELLLVVDEMQNLYKRNLTWIDSMSGTKFRGRWRQLKESYRLPDPVIEKVNKFIWIVKGSIFYRAHISQDYQDSILILSGKTYPRLMRQLNSLGLFSMT